VKAEGQNETDEPFKAYWLSAPTGLTFKNFKFCPHCILYSSQNKQRLCPA